MRFLKGIGMLLLILVRGCALWVMFPFAFVAWLLVHSWAQKASVRQALCWYHAHLLVLLLNGPFRPFFAADERPHFRDVPKMSAVEPHKIRLIGMDVVSLAG
ncbi:MULTISPECIES: hypothetical protein [unclassified Microbacterium]|uniref:hypothetical protein n=1 Tax=unclassified Microbacterium TaxID=2609290 RepID=UPI0004934C37|nr:MULTISPECIES: hypothetical protein [unclassified Microbacterium]